MNLSDLLSHNLPLFAGLAEDDLSGFQPDFQERKYKSWQTVFNQEDRSREVLFLLDGSLLAVYWTPEGREIIFSRFEVGAYLGEIAALDGGERSLAVVARSPITVLALTQDSFLSLLDNVPVVRRRIVNDLAARVRKLTARNVELTTLSVEQRVCAFLVSLAIDRRQLIVGGILMDAPTHAEIAATIGANREMVSRTITKLGKRGAIKSARKRIEILCPDTLSAGF